MTRSFSAIIMSSFPAIAMSGITLVSLFLLFGCAIPEPVPIAYGKDECVNCRMSISDSKFGAEVVTTKAKTYKFDALECMLGWYAAGSVPQTDIHSLWVTDFIRPGTLIDARTAFYLESAMFRSPMGMNYAAFGISEERLRARFNYPGNDRTFDDALAAAKAR